MNASAPAATPLGPVLGRLARPGTAAPEDALRLALVDRMITTPPVDGADWVAAWRITAIAFADAIMAEARDGIERAALHARLPGRRLQAELPSDQEREVLIERFAAEAMQLEALADLGGDAQAVQRRRAAALNLAWDGALELSRVERRRWQRRAETVAQWRRPWRPLAITAALLLGGGLVVAAWLGGWWPAPAWFHPAIDAFWGLPWP